MLTNKHFDFNVAILEIYGSEYVSHRLPDRFILMWETICEIELSL